MYKAIINVNILCSFQNANVNKTRRIPSLSSINEEASNYKSTRMMDSNVLRLIRRYDSVGSNTTTGLKTRRSFENARGIWHTLNSNTTLQQSFGSSPFLSRSSLTTAYEDETPTKQISTPYLHRQQAIHETETLPSTLTLQSVRPILEYGSLRSRSEFIVQPHHIEPLTIKIEPPALSTNEQKATTTTTTTTTTYQPLITTGTKRVCLALSKSEWDLRLQPEQLSSSRSPSPWSIAKNDQQENESHRSSSSVNRSKSSPKINNNDNEIDDFDETSAPIITDGSCVKKLKQLFITKSSLDLTSSSLNNNHPNVSIDSKPNRSYNKLSTSTKRTPSSIESQQSIINQSKSTTIVQEVLPISSFSNKKSILRNQKTIDK